MTRVPAALTKNVMAVRPVKAVRGADGSGVQPTTGARAAGRTAPFHTARANVVSNVRPRAVR
ncbi:hypothetical protein, partial [Burkholderia cenocepacia]|uniref:hypothetical protein n=1 Tax=Burkholderia cenocepacia TaxID=95486 RepID=UPI001E348D4A